ncbi:phage tail tape measure protein [Streptomyces sp. URMC 124]|uniref:phage tail tape measure protein n=1 Tax=Streptomyces sp. URMC 124 TaxID=3423405 RepID=UPI003F1A687B
MANVGYASIQIIPSVRGIGAELRAQLVGPAGEAGEAAGEEAGSGFKDRLKQGAAAAGVAAGALIVAGLHEAMEQANITGILRAQLGATGPQAAKYGKVAGQLYSHGITESFEQGAEAIRSIVNAGLVPPDATNKQLESIAAKMADVSTTFGTDMSLQTQAVSALLKNGLAPSAEDALDVITVGMQRLGPNAEDLLETFQEYPVQLKKLGLDAQTSLGLFRQGLQGGARDTDIIADAFKEFSIRAIDMSKGSREAYEALGLSAEKMEAQISKGGEGARAGLQTVLDKLRAMKDPVERNAAAVGLFGTQAEDLGAALFKLDPGKAATGMGKLGGAAGQLGKDLHSGPTHEIEVFTRTLKQNFVDFLGGQVLPVLGQIGTGVNTYVLPPLMAVSSALLGTVMPALSSLKDAGLGVVGWLRDMGTWLIPIGIAVGGFTLALTAQAVATAAVTAVFSLYRAAILAWTVVQNGATLAMGAFNLVMNANPVILGITAILALGAALVVAYQKVGWFRDAVQAAWAGIQAAAMWAWNSVLKPALAGIVTGAQAVGAAAVWLWSNVLSPVFSAIGLGARVLLAIVVTAVITPIYLAIKLLGAIATWLWAVAFKPALEGIAAVALWLWTAAIRPAFQGIAAVATWLWANAVKPTFDLFMGGVRLLGSVATWLWRNIAVPVFQGIALVVRAWWDSVLATFTAVRSFITGPLAGTFRWIYDSVIRPVWSAAGSVISSVWRNVISPAFDLLKRGVRSVADAFDSGVGFIGRVWSTIKDKTRAPVQFVVDVVYNNGIRKVWNTVAGLLDLGKLEAVKFARGGRTRGGVPGRDSIPALMMADEYVVRRDSARKIGFGTLDYINRYGALPFAAGGPVQRFADGGIVSDIWGGITGAAKTIGGWAGSAWDILTDPEKIWDKIIQPTRDKIRSIATSQWAQGVAGLPLKMIKELKDKVVSAAKKFLDFGGGNIGGSGVERWSGVVLQALKLVGQPASLLPIVLRRMNQESGGNPMAINLWDSNAQAGDPSRGLMQTIASTFNAYAGPLRSRGIYDPLANVYASMRYALARYGSLAAAYNRPGGYDSGGWLMPGYSSVFNGTRRPEAVLTGPQWDVMTAAAAGGFGDLHVQVYVGDREITDIARAEVRRSNGQLVQTLRAGRR